ncbi:MAG: DUF6268 family outer membrane beta-barrel protein [Planctomycetota bacterium]|nr:DUF6268 family outer membrane beta-barrel protein [Planctomycetota bacterium]
MPTLDRARRALLCTALAIALFASTAGCASGPLSTPAAPGPGGDPANAYREPGDGALRAAENLPLALRDLGGRDPWTLTFSGSTGYILGGEDGPDAFTNAVAVSLTHRFHIASTLTMTLAYNRREYDLADDRGLFEGLGAEPGQLHTLAATVSLFQPLSMEWAVFLSAGTAASTEVGVEMFEDPSFIGIAVLGHKVNENLSLGAGVLTAVRPEEDPFFFPIPFVDWQINERWRFKTEDAGAGFTYKATDTLDLIGMVMFDTRRYRLDAKGPGTPGIFEDSRTSLVARAMWEPSDSVRMVFTGGIDILRYLEVADEDGRVLRDEDAGIGGFFRFLLSVAF